MTTSTLARNHVLLAIFVAVSVFAGCSDDSSSGGPDTLPTNGGSTGGGVSFDVPDNGGATGGASDMDMEDDAPLTCTPVGLSCLNSTQILDCKEDGSETIISCNEGEACFDGVCAPIICEPFTVNRCVEFQYEGCNAAGTQEGLFDCPTGFTCVPAGGPGNPGATDACTPRICEDGDIQCVEGDGDAFLECNPAGTAFVDRGNKCSDEDVRRVCDEGECKPLCEALIKDSSYIGCDYWAVDLDNFFSPTNDAAGQRFAVVVSNANETLPANVLVYLEDGYNSVPREPIVTRMVQPGALEVIELPPNCYPDVGPTCPQAYLVNNTMQRAAAYRVVSDVPITAYQFNPLDNSDAVFSNDASLLFPEPSLGVRYLVMTRGQQFDEHPSYVTIVASENEGQPTQVTITPSVRTRAGATASGQMIPSIPAGQSETFTLQPFDVLNISSGQANVFNAANNTYDNSGDLTGTEIVANGRIAVFGGAECVDVPQTNPRTEACDHLEQQLYPVNSWGLTYIAAKSWPRGQSRDLWRVMARRDNTVIQTIPDVTGGPRTLNAGEWFEFPSRENFAIEANRQILVGQFLTGILDPINPEDGTPNADIGDPAYMLAVPVEQYRTTYTFLVPDAYERDYVTIIAPDNTTFEFDGEELTEDDVITRGGFVVPITTVRVGSRDVAFNSVRFLVSDGPHTLETSEPVGLNVYGFSPSVSYAYPGGLDLKEVSQ